MRGIVISPATRQLLAARAGPGFKLGVAKFLPISGLYEIEVDDEVYERLRAIDPDPDKAIAIVCSTGVGNA